jgi:hypothetical protein
MSSEPISLIHYQVGQFSNFLLTQPYQRHTFRPVAAMERSDMAEETNHHIASAISNRQAQLNKILNHKF